MYDLPGNPAFTEGDRVRVINPVANADLSRVGVIRGVKLSGSTYHYFVVFEDGTSDVMFACELENVDPQTATGNSETAPLVSP